MNFEYKIKKSKGRNIRISINRLEEVFLHVPRFMPEFIAKRFLVSRREWVERSLEKIKKINSLTTPGPYFKRRGKSAIRKEYLEKKEQARILVKEKLEYWKLFYKQNFGIDFEWKKVAIKNSRTRWGSCSSKKNLNFSFRILELTDVQQSYLIVHELSHLLQMNHSQNFWNLVKLGIPNYIKLRSEMRKFNLN